MDGLDLILSGFNPNIGVITGGTQHYDATYFDGGPLASGYTATHLTMVANRLYATPLILPAGSYDRIGLHLGTSAAAGKLARCGLYLPGSNGLPGALALDPAADIAADSAPGYMLQTISFVVPQPTLYYAVVWSDGAPVIGGWPTPGRSWFGSGASSVTKAGMVYVSGNTYPTFPATYGAPTAIVAGSVARVLLRAA